MPGSIPQLLLRDFGAGAQQVYVAAGRTHLQHVWGTFGHGLLSALRLQGLALRLHHHHLPGQRGPLRLPLPRRRVSDLRLVLADHVRQHGLDDRHHHDLRRLRRLQSQDSLRTTHRGPLRELGRPHRLSHGRCPHQRLHHEQTYSFPHADESQSVNILNKLEKNSALREKAAAYLREGLWRVWKNYKLKLYIPSRLNERKRMQEFRLSRRERDMACIS